MKPSPFILHDKSDITNCATTSCGEGSGEGKNAKKGEGKQGEAFTRISLCDNRLGLNGEEVKAKNRKTADARVRAREQNSPNATAPLHNRSAQHKACPKRANKNSHLSTLFIEKQDTSILTQRKTGCSSKKCNKKKSLQIFFSKKNCIFAKNRPAGYSPLIRRRHPAHPQSQFAPQRTAQRNNAFFSTPSIHPDT